jgi:hypothetical protein
VAAIGLCLLFRSHGILYLDRGLSVCPPRLVRVSLASPTATIGELALYARYLSTCKANKWAFWGGGIGAVA